MGRIVAFVGGARSGKSRLAVGRARAHGDAVAFVATAEPGDEEMRRRIEAHRRDRPPSWRTLEAPRGLAEAIRGLRAGGVRCILVDCLTLWIANRLCGGAAPPAVLSEFEEVLEAARAAEAEVVFVSNEVGCGLVPETPLGRAFRDTAGQVNQRLAAAADEACWVVCGKAVRIT